MQYGDPTTWTKDETAKTFFSPLSKDLVIEYRNDDGTYQAYIIPMLSPSTYPTYLADHFIKHIVDAVINERGLGYITPEERAEIQKEVEK